jgi:predicted DsbA family dithiol-disulfide isomerase
VKSWHWLIVVVILAAAGTWGGYVLGERAGRRAGYQIGVQHGRVKAARDGPPQVRDVRHPLSALTEAPAWRGLPELSDLEAASLADLVNRAPSPCGRQARRGHSLATNLVDADQACASADEQVRLALAALRTFGPDDPEALAVLRVERRGRPDVDGRHRRGNVDADVVVVEWGDFQCPYCTRAQRLLTGLLEERDDVAVVFKHMPLSFHPAAFPAALAAEAAGEQGQFWAMHDALFDLGKNIADHVDRDDPLPTTGPVPFEELAAELGLDVQRFRDDMRSERLQERVSGDAAEARALGVSGTPNFFVGNRQVNRRVSVELLARLVDKARAEEDWRFSWDLDPPPPGAVEEADEQPEPAGEAAE